MEIELREDGKYKWLPNHYPNNSNLKSKSHLHPYLISSIPHLVSGGAHFTTNSDIFYTNEPQVKIVPFLRKYICHACMGWV